MNVAGRLVKSEISHAVAVTKPALIIVAKAVAVVPTCTERLLGRTADTIVPAAISDRQLATVNAVAFNEAAASADCGDDCATPVGKPLNKTLGLEKFCMRTQPPHDAATPMMSRKPRGVSTYPCEKGNTPSAGASARSCCKPMLCPSSWPNEKLPVAQIRATTLKA